jgi:predicted permease
MQVVINVALPVFAIMLSGFLAGRLHLLDDAASYAINQYVYWFALPAVLFISLARTPLADVLNVSFLCVFIGSTLLVYTIAWLIGVFSNAPGSGHHAQQGLAASFSNTGYMGIPIFIAAWGPEHTLPAIVATVALSAVMLTIAVIAQELIGKVGDLSDTVKDLVKALSRNPLVISAVAGLLWTAFRLPIPLALNNFFTISAGSAGPCALFAIGLFLAGRRLHFDRRELGWIVGLKLLGQPAITWILATALFPMDQFWMGAALLLSALPTGSLTFVVAQRYSVYVEQTSQVIFISTLLSLPLLAGLLAIYAGG